MFDNLHCFWAGVAKDLIEKVQDPYYLESSAAQTIYDVSRSVELFSPMAGAWVGESGGAYNSGGKDVSHTFANGFWSFFFLSFFLSLLHKFKISLLFTNLIYIYLDVCN